MLSLFPGADLLGRGFEAEGWHVLRGPDLLWGQRIEGYHPPAGVFAGVIAGSPCQDFSDARRDAPSGYGIRMLTEFLRCVFEAQPDWFLLENVRNVPDVRIEGYDVQRFDLRGADCGCAQRRLRHFQFGSRDGSSRVIPRSVTASAQSQPACTASEGNKRDRRSWPDFCELQGLPRDFDLPALSRTQKYHAVGNGVPVPMARLVAAAIRERAAAQSAWSLTAEHQKPCICGCGRIATGRKRAATDACRKRQEMARRAPRPIVSFPGA